MMIATFGEDMVCWVLVGGGGNVGGDWIAGDVEVVLEGSTFVGFTWPFLA